MGHCRGNQEQDLLMRSRLAAIAGAPCCYRMSRAPKMARLLDLFGLKALE